jgi:hypothetical protein
MLSATSRNLVVKNVTWVFDKVTGQNWITIFENQNFMYTGCPIMLLSILCLTLYHAILWP